jgi:hypothetical protein
MTVITSSGLTPAMQAYPAPGAAAGAFSINGYPLGAGGGGLGTSNATLDLSQWGLAQLEAQINQTQSGGLVGVTATTGPQGRLQISSPAGVPIVIAGAAAVLIALGLTSGSFVS